MTSSVLHTQEELIAQIPPSYRPAGPKSVETGSTTEESGISRDLLRAPIPIWIIQAGGMRLRARKPVMVKLTSDDEYFFAGNDALSVYGTGFTAQEAIDDLNIHIYHFYRYYRALRADQVIGEAARLKRLFSQVLDEE